VCCRFPRPTSGEGMLGGAGGMLGGGFKLRPPTVALGSTRYLFPLRDTALTTRAHTRRNQPDPFPHRGGKHPDTLPLLPARGPVKLATASQREERWPNVGTSPVKKLYGCNRARRTASWAACCCCLSWSSSSATKFK
jgi:hypothetical protein